MSEMAVAAEPMAPELAARVTAFARACRAAARAVALYPSDHPTAAVTLDAVTAAAQAATAQAPLRLTVVPDALTIDGRRVARQDQAIAELAGLLHRHQVGMLSVHPQTTPVVWRLFLALLATPPEQARLRGGLSRLWASEGEARIELRAVNYDELLRVRIGGERATWEAIATQCLEGLGFSLDDAVAELLFGILDDPARIAGVMAAIESRLPSGEASRQGPLILAGLLQAVAQFAAAANPADAEPILDALADAAARLPLATLQPIVDAQRGSARPGLARFVQGLAGRVSDGAVAALVAAEVRGGRGTSPRLADVFCGLAPDPRRRSAIIALARDAVEQPGTASDPAAAAAWQQSEEMLLAYSDRAFVSNPYNSELDRLASRAVDLDDDHTDSPTLIAAWRDTVGEDDVRLLDAELLGDLMRLQQDFPHWRDLAGLVLQRVNVLLVVGDFRAAVVLAEGLRKQAETHPDPGVRAAAAEALQQVLTPSTMRHVATHLDTADRSVVLGAQRFCAAVGTAAIGPLAEVVSREERSRPREHLIGILVSFGAPGRQSVERLRQSPNAAVRRTAVLLLRQFGGQEALPELASLLDDDEPRVKREATHAIAMLGTETAFDVLVRALVRGPDVTRTSVLGVLWTLPNEDAEPVIAHLVLKAPSRGPMFDIFARLIERLGMIGGRQAVDALAAVLQRRRFWARFRMAALHRVAIDALGRVGTPAALAVLEAAAESGPRLVRGAARARLAEAAGRAAMQGQES